MAAILLIFILHDSGIPQKWKKKQPFYEATYI